MVVDGLYIHDPHVFANSNCLPLWFSKNWLASSSSFISKVSSWRPFYFLMKNVRPLQFLSVINWGSLPKRAPSSIGSPSCGLSFSIIMWLVSCDWSFTLWPPLPLSTQASILCIYWSSIFRSSAFFQQLSSCRAQMTTTSFSVLIFVVFFSFVTLVVSSSSNAIVAVLMEMRYSLKSSPISLSFFYFSLFPKRLLLSPPFCGFSISHVIFQGLVLFSNVCYSWYHLWS